MMMTSASAVPISSGRSGPGGVIAAHSELGQETFATGIVVLSFSIVAGEPSIALELAGLQAPDRSG
jgi:hypothetical protein